MMWKLYYQDTCSILSTPLSSFGMWFFYNLLAYMALVSLLISKSTSIANKPAYYCMI